MANREDWMKYGIEKGSQLLCSGITKQIQVIEKFHSWSHELGSTLDVSHSFLLIHISYFSSNTHQRHG